MAENELTAIMFSREHFNQGPTTAARVDTGDEPDWRAGEEEHDFARRENKSRYLPRSFTLTASDEP